MNKRFIIVQLTLIVLAVVSLGSSSKVAKHAKVTLFTDYKQNLPGTDVKISMIAVNGGSYVQGSSAKDIGHQKDEGPAHKVAIDGFWIGEFEITWEQYNLFARREIDAFKLAEGKSDEVVIKLDGVSSATTPYVDMSFGMGKDGYPAINVTQYAASVFCQWLSATTGRFYRLPTEAEWEYACRAGSTTAYCFGDSREELSNYAWYYDNSNESYHKVGTKKPNAWGIYDMHGNVAEWTLDQYDASFYATKSKSPSQNAWNHPTKLYPRTARGGSWYDDPEHLRSAARRPSSPNWKKRDPQIPKSLWWHTNAPFIGFRIVRPKKAPPKEEQKNYWIQPIEDI